MSMPLSQMTKKVEAARAAWELIHDPKKRYEGGRDGRRLLLEPPLFAHISILIYVSWAAHQAGFVQKDITDQFGYGKFVEWGIEYALPPKLREHAWISMAGKIAAYNPDRDPHLRAALGEDWKQRLLEELPTAVRLAFNESGPGEPVAPDRIGKKRSITSRTKRLLLRTGDEAAEKKRVTPERLEPEEMELALFVRQEAQEIALAAEENFFTYLSALTPHQGETRRVVVGTANITVTRWLDEVKTKIPFTKREARVFDLLRETSDRHEIARRLGVKPESVTRTKTRIKEKTEAHVPIIVS